MLDELASDEDEINEDDVQYIEGLAQKVLIRIVSDYEYFNPLSPNIHIEILYTDLHTFPWRISWESLIIDQSIFSLVINSLTLITIVLATYRYC